MKIKILVLSILLCFSTHLVLAQGPPITSDKAIMLAQGNIVVKTLSEYRQTDLGTFTKVPLMVHYIAHPKILLGVHLPFTSHNFNTENNLFEDDFKNGSSLGDIELLGKYQFYRNDKMAKTLRMVIKTVQTLPTGKEYDIEGISTGAYQSYLSWVTGYETIKYGISNELGFRISPNENFNELVHKFGVGLPLLKPIYPVKQVNLYFEYSSAYMFHHQAFMMLYAQGVQYAIKRLTLETAIQFPLIQTENIPNPRQFSWLVGTRYVF